MTQIVSNFGGDWGKDLKSEKKLKKLSRDCFVEGLGKENSKQDSNNNNKKDLRNGEKTHEREAFDKENRLLLFQN